MQTILGANGQIARELAKELKRKYTDDIRLVSRTPQKVNETDSVFPADLLYAESAEEAVRGSEIVYFTVGLPVDSSLWVKQFPVIMNNVISACKKNRAKLVFFDNTYMYPQNDEILYENTDFKPVGRKGQARAKTASILLEEIRKKTIEAVICRAPEFYGPGKTKSITMSLVFDNLKSGKKIKVLLRDDKLRTLIWTPDASKATALIGNTPDAFNQTWHLPCDDNRLTYKQIIDCASEVSGQELQYSVVRRLPLKIAGVFQKNVKELEEVLPRYEHDNLFDSSKFKTHFPDFPVTSYKQGIRQILEEKNA